MLVAFNVARWVKSISNLRQVFLEKCHVTSRFDERRSFEGGLAMIEMVKIDNYRQCEGLF